MRPLAGHRRTERAAITEGSASSGAFRRGRIGRTFRRVSRFVDTVGARINARNGSVWALAFLGGWIGYGMALGGQYRVFFDDVTAAAGFAVEKVEIRGLVESDSTEIVDRIDLTRHPSLLTLDPETARRRVAEIPWLADVSVKKAYPNKLVVSLRERKAYALWQDDGRIKVVDQAGAVMADELQPQHADLPLVVGHAANTRAGEAIALMASVPELRAKLRAAVLVAERRWNLVTVDGVEIRLPEENPATALAEVARLDAAKKLLDRDIIAVDMRAPDRLTIKLSDAAAQARKDLLKLRNAKKKGTET